MRTWTIIVDEFFVELGKEDSSTEVYDIGALLCIRTQVYIIVIFINLSGTACVQ